VAAAFHAASGASLLREKESFRGPLGSDWERLLGRLMAGFLA